jgi:hypothetical protein
MSAAFDAMRSSTPLTGLDARRSTPERSLQIAVYGGSALMLASNFRFATEDVDVSKLDLPLPDWLATVAQELADQNHWQKDWFNDGVAFHLSPLAGSAADHLEFGIFPRDGTPAGLVVSVPSAEYLLALKLKAFRVMDPIRGEPSGCTYCAVVGISTVDDAIALLGRYFPSAQLLRRSNSSC